MQLSLTGMEQGNQRLCSENLLSSECRHLPEKWNTKDQVKKLNICIGEPNSCLAVNEFLQAAINLTWLFSILDSPG